MKKIIYLVVLLLSFSVISQTTKKELFVKYTTNEIIIDFDEINNLNFPALDHVYIAIGMRLTTFELIHIKNNKRKEFFKVDHDLVYNIAKKAFDVGARSIAIVSAVGADMNSSNFYLQTKGKMKNSIKEIGYEKIIVNSTAYRDRHLITQIAEELGNQCVIGAIDVKKNIFGKYLTCSNSGKQKEHKNPFEWAKELESLGAGEIMVTSINQEGTWKGFDLNLIKKIVESVNVPIIGHGGAGSLDHINKLFNLGTNAAAVGSMVVYQKKGMGVLINFPI